MSLFVYNNTLEKMGKEAISLLHRFAGCFEEHQRWQIESPRTCSRNHRVRVTKETDATCTSSYYFPVQMHYDSDYVIEIYIYINNLRYKFLYTVFPCHVQKHRLPQDEIYAPFVCNFIYRILFSTIPTVFEPLHTYIIIIKSYSMQRERGEVSDN